MLRFWAVVTMGYLAVIGFAAAQSTTQINNSQFTQSVTITGKGSVRPIITVSPANPSISDFLGFKDTKIADYKVTNSDNSAFTGSVSFGLPNMDSNGIFSLNRLTPDSGQILISPSGPGIPIITPPSQILSITLQAND